MNKTPIYVKRAQKSYRQRKLKNGWKYFSVLAPSPVIDELRKLHKLLMRFDNE